MKDSKELTKLVEDCRGFEEALDIGPAGSQHHRRVARTSSREVARCTRRLAGRTGALEPGHDPMTL